jgi:hypothetical protein
VLENIEAREDAEPSEEDATASRIAAAHEAVAEAPQRSAIAALANYKRAVAENNREAAALSLAAAAGKPPDDAITARANALLGIGDQARAE